MRHFIFLLLSTGLLSVSCSDEYLAERRDGLKWEKDRRQAQEHRYWDRPTKEEESDKD